MALAWWLRSAGPQARARGAAVAQPAAGRAAGQGRPQHHPPGVPQMDQATGATLLYDLGLIMSLSCRWGAASCGHPPLLWTGISAPALLCRHTSVPHKPGADSAVAHSDTMRGCELQQALPAMRCAALAKSARGVLCARQANSKLHQRTAHQGAGLSMMRLTGARQCASNFLHRWCRVPVARDSADAIRLARCLGGHCGVSGIRCPAAAAAHVSQEHAPDNQQSSSE